MYTNLLSSCMYSMTPRNEIATVSIFGNCTDREMDIHTVFGGLLCGANSKVDNSVIVSSGVVSVETRSTSLRITTRLDTCTVMYHVDSILLLVGNGCDLRIRRTQRRSRSLTGMIPDSFRFAACFWLKWLFSLVSLLYYYIDFSLFPNAKRSIHRKQTRRK